MCVFLAPVPACRYVGVRAPGSEKMLSKQELNNFPPDTFMIR